ncbi:MAG: NAD(+) diphosphatase [Magnetovibrionaceae bacterium]
MPKPDRPAIPYATATFDRLTEARRQPDFAEQAAYGGGFHLHLLWRGRHFGQWAPRPEKAWTPGWLTGAEAKVWLEPFPADLMVLGADGPDILGALDISALDEGEVEAAFGPERFADLRTVSPLLDARSVGPLLLARGLAHWHRNARFCGACGHPTGPMAAGFSRICRNPDCAIEHHPRTDPATIMLVVRDDPLSCLLASAPRFPDGMVSTLAGFVEVGENLEACVRREVKEEAGIDVGAVAYQGSQPWPFPASLMMGFRAEALSSSITLDPEELCFADWFTPDDLFNLEEKGLFLPRGDSISSWLIRTWLDEIAEG